MYGAIFNSRDLGTGDYQIYKIDVNMPKNKVSKYELVQSDGQVVTSRFYGERVVRVSGRILANTLNEMQSRLDTLKIWLDGYEKFLDIKIGDTDRRYVATVLNFNYNIKGYFCEWDIDFTCDSLASDSATTSLTMGTYTSSPTSYTNTIGGTYYAEPSFDLTVTRVLPYWTSKYIELKNAVRNERMRMTRTWLPGDRVIINGKTKVAQIYAGTTQIVSDLDSIIGWTGTNGTLTLDNTNEIQGTGCADMNMATAQLTTNIERLNSGSYDLSSSAGKLYIPIFIPTPTSGVLPNEIRFMMGSDATFATNLLWYNITTQWDGSAITGNAWNYFVIDLSTTPSSTTGTPVRTAIKCLRLSLNFASVSRLVSWKADYIASIKTTTTLTPLDYEGSMPGLDIGSSTIITSDELTTRNITMTGSYYKRYI